MLADNVGDLLYYKKSSSVLQKGNSERELEVERENNGGALVGSVEGQGQKRRQPRRKRYIQQRSLRCFAHGTKGFNPFFLSFLFDFSFSC